MAPNNIPECNRSICETTEQTAAMRNANRFALVNSFFPSRYCSLFSKALEVAEFSEICHSISPCCDWMKACQNYIGTMYSECFSWQTINKFVSNTFNSKYERRILNSFASELYENWWIHNILQYLLNTNFDDVLPNRIFIEWRSIHLVFRNGSAYFNWLACIQITNEFSNRRTQNRRNSFSAAAVWMAILEQSQWTLQREWARMYFACYA